MTEEEWLACSDPTPMLDFLRGKVSDRKLRLFACAFCRRFQSGVDDELLCRGVEAAERYADGGGMKTELRRVRRALQGARQALPYANGLSRAAWAAYYLAECAATENAYVGVADEARRLVDTGVVQSGPDEESCVCALLRDLFGNPFRPVSLVPAWLTPAVLNLAQAAYDNRLLPSGLLDNTGLAILADALEEAGCTDPDILSHLRGPGPHVRGCWPVDLILGKE